MDKAKPRQPDIKSDRRTIHMATQSRRPGSILCGSRMRQPEDPVTTADAGGSCGSANPRQERPGMPTSGRQPAGHRLGTAARHLMHRDARITLKESAPPLQNHMQAHPRRPEAAPATLGAVAIIPLRAEI